MKNQVLTTRALRCVSHCTQDATNTEMAASMDVWRIKGSQLLDCFRYTGVIRLRQNFFNQILVCHAVDDPRNEVSCQAVWSRHVYYEVRRGEWPIHHTSSTSVASNVQAILLRSSCDGIAVTAEPCIGIENLRIKPTGGCFVLRFGIQGPVPVPARRLDWEQLMLQRVFSGPELTYGWPPVYPHSSLSAFSYVAVKYRCQRRK
jgi:hypothetical protein